MERCETCGNEYNKAFQVTVSGQSHTFDRFECAIHFAPTAAESVKSTTARVAWQCSPSPRQHARFGGVD